MPTFNIGPCDCCGGTPVTCCETCPPSCIDLTVTLNGTSADGTYTAVWNGSTGWDVDFGVCTTTIYCDDSGASPLFEMFNEPWASCPIGATCGEGRPHVVMSPAELCDNCDLGLPGGTISIDWPCIYPEICTINTTFTDGSCDCSPLTGAVLGIDCSSSSPLTSFVWKGEVTSGGCTFELQVVYNCETQTLSYSDPYAAYATLSPVTLNDLLAGGPIVMSDNTSPGDGRCVDPASVSVSFSNNGVWCP